MDEQIKISNNQNTIIIGDATYQAEDNKPCIECDLRGSMLCIEIPCDETERKNRNNVIFKLKKQTT